MVGWVKLHRNLLDWEWWDDHNATRLLIYLLCAVNYEPKKWKGIIVEPGSLITSYENMAMNTNLTVKQVRVAMGKLEDSGEVARKRARKGQLVTLLKWDKMQIKELQEGSKQGDKKAVKGQEEGRQRATTKEVKNLKNLKNQRKEVSFPPDFFDFENYAIEKAAELNLEIDQSKLKAKYMAWKEAGWRTGKGNQIKNWKATLLNTLNYLQKEKSSVKKEKTYMEKLAEI